MFLRVVGIGLLILLAVPLIIAYPPLALLGIGGWFLVAKGRRGSTSQRARRSGSGSRPKRTVRRSTSLTLSPWLRQVIMWLALGIGAVAIGATMAREAPGLLAALVALGLIFLIWNRGRFRGRGSVLGFSRGQPPIHRLPASTVSLGTEFERHVVHLLKAQNYRSVRHVGGAGDRGIDIVAEDNRGRTFLVQCKRYRNGAKVGSVDIQKLMGAVVHEGADGGIFVTTASYTPAAIDLARTGRVHIALYDGRDVARLSQPGLW